MSDCIPKTVYENASRCVVDSEIHDCYVVYVTMNQVDSTHPRTEDGFVAAKARCDTLATQGRTYEYAASRSVTHE